MLVWAPYGFSLPGFPSDVVGDPKVQARVATLLGDAASDVGSRTRATLPRARTVPQGADRSDLPGMALVFGTAGLPHILMRFFTVRTGAAGAPR